MPIPMKGPALYRRARRVIPGGTQLLSKRPEMFLPEQWPSYYERAEGAEIWDLDGNRYVDMSYAGIGACVLGYADREVNAAVMEAVGRGSLTTLNCPEEVDLAELLCELHPWAEMVRYARTGGEAMAVAVRIARAKTRKSKIVFSGYHGWHDWYLAANLGTGNALEGHLLPGLEPAGVPGALAGTAIPFVFNDGAGFLEALRRAGDELAAVVMEPARSAMPEREFVELVREETRRRGAVLIFDEITAAWRQTTGGLHLLMGVEPDMAVYAKGISNGYPMAAILGRGEVMEAAQETFISSTYWTERIGPVAALATIRKHGRVKAGERLMATGSAVQEAWREAARETGLEITVSGMPPLGRFTFNYGNAQAVKTLFTQLMLERGYLASTAFYAMWAHTAEQVRGYREAVVEVFRQLGSAIAEGSVERQLRGGVAHTGFARLTS